MLSTIMSSSPFQDKLTSMLEPYKLQEFLLYQVTAKLFCCPASSLKRRELLVPFSSLCHMLQGLATLGPLILDCYQSCRKVSQTQNQLSQVR